jgi:small conductance mechanosensitive channel
VGDIDDKATFIPHDARTWVKIKHHPVTHRLSRVLISILIAVVTLVIVNVSMAPRDIPCATFDDCRKIKRLNTVLLGTRSLLNLLIVVLLVFAIMAQCGINPVTLFATAGVLGIILGFGAQSMIKSAFAGVMIMISGRFTMGDFVSFEMSSAPSIKGVVINFSLQTTTVQDFSGARFFVSNGDITVVTNYSHNDQRAQVEVLISHLANIDVVMQHLQLLTFELASDPKLLDKVIRPPVVKGITATNAHSYTVAIAAIVSPATEMFVERYMRQKILTLLQSLNVHASIKYNVIHPADAPTPIPGTDVASPKDHRTTTPDTVRTPTHALHSHPYLDTEASDQYHHSHTMGNMDLRP